MKKIIVLLCVFGWACQPQVESIQIEKNINLEHPTPNTTIRALLERIKQSENGFAQISIAEDSLWLEGYVISDDRAGNFYKELWIQDAPENPEYGIRVRVDRRALSDYFVRGSKVFVFLNGLGVGNQNGQPTLGKFQGNAIGHVSEFLWENHIMRTQEIHPIIAKIHPFGEFQEEDLGLWLRFENLQFSSAELGKTFAGETYDAFDGERRLLSCTNYHSVWLSSSSYCRFKSITLSENKGAIEAILTRDYYDEKYILKINDPEDLSLTEGRCFPFFEESFEQYRLGLFQEEGWMNYAEVGSRFWEVYADENALGQSLKINSYRSGEERSISWLVLPEFNFSGLNNPVLTFRSSTHFPDASTLTVWVASELNSDFSLIQWLPLDVRIANRGDDPDKWIDSGSIFLSDLPEGFRIGFRYEGSGKTSSDGTYELDDFFLVDQPIE